MYEEFEKDLTRYLKQLNIELNVEQIKKFYDFMNMLLEWNEKINLTAITEQNDVILKHFVDSLTVAKYLNENQKVIDIGTGAGFPGIPVSIIKNKNNYTLVDSLNKRINFLNEVKGNLKLDNVTLIHSRAEELGRNKLYREKFDIAFSRAVANLTVLAEYLIPLVKTGGTVICMKGSNVKEEVEESKFAINELGGSIKEIKEFCLPESDIKRNIIIIEKVKLTPIKYPRKAGMPAKLPLK